MAKKFSAMNKKWFLSFLTFQTLSRIMHRVKNVLIRSYSGPYFPAFGLNTQSECGKIRTRITPNTDTFYAVMLSCEVSKYCKHDCSILTFVGIK